jgi:hypothetical protein
MTDEPPLNYTTGMVWLACEINELPMIPRPRGSSDQGVGTKMVTLKALRITSLARNLSAPELKTQTLNFNP